MTDTADQPASTGKKPALRWLIWIFGVIAGLVIFVTFAFLIYGQPSPRSRIPKYTALAKSIFPLIKMYAGDHDGNYPRTLAELEPDYCPSLEALKYRDPVSARSYDWMYIQGLRETSPAHWIILASPTNQLSEQPGKGFRIVVYNDGSAIWIRSDQFDAQVKAMAAQTPEKP